MLSPQIRGSGLLSRHDVALRLSLLQAACFAGIAVHMPFFPAWLSMQGLSEKEIGLALALGMITRMLAAPAISALGDGRCGAVAVLTALHVLAAAGYLVMPALGGVIALTLAVVAASVISAAVVPLCDHLTVAQVRARPELDYGRIRVWGSVSFLVITILGGYLFTFAGVGAVPYAIAALSLVAAITAFSAPEDPGWRAAQSETAEAAPRDARRDLLLWCCIGASALINAAHAPIYGFATIYWASFGWTPGAIGWLWGIGVLTEIVFLWWVGPCAGRSIRAGLLWLGVSVLCVLLRFLPMPFVDSYWAFFVLQALHAGSFGAQLTGVMIIISVLARDGRRAGVQGRLGAVNACLMGAGTFASGLLYEALGGYIFALAAPVALAGLGLIVIALRMARRLALEDEAALPVGDEGARGAGP